VSNVVQDGGEPIHDGRDAGTDGGLLLDGHMPDQGEEGGDEEPSLCGQCVTLGRSMVDGTPLWPEQTQVRDSGFDQTHWSSGGDSDCEAEHDGREPSLGWTAAAYGHSPRHVPAVDLEEDYEGEDDCRALPTERPTQFDVDPEYLPDRYCMTVSGTCMEPEIADGALMEFAKGPVKPGDTVAIFRRPSGIGAGEFHILVKRLVAVTKDGVYMAMLNPPKTLWLPPEDVVGIHRCVGPMPLDRPRRLIRQDELRLRRGDRSDVYSAPR
jgi:hypothetical protein